jgi:hypothetical protein
VHARAVGLAARAAQRRHEIQVDATASTVTIALTGNFSECIRLDGAVTATLDGTPFELTTRGGYVPPAASDAASSCDSPTFQIATSPASPASDIVISDGKTTFTATVPALRAVRGYSAGGLARGAQARFSWAVPTDVSVANDYDRPYILWQPDQGAAFSLEANAITINGTDLVATIPADAATGSGAFNFNAVTAPPVTACSGIASCTVGAVHPRALTATIAP